MRMRLKEVKWTLWVKEELGACCRQRAQSERELGRQMRLLLTASTEHLMARDGGPQPPPSTPLVSHFIAFSRPPLSAFVNMSSHHSYFTVISIVSRFFCFVWAMVFFFFFFPRKVLCFSSFTVSELENRTRHWCRGDLFFFFFGRRGLCILYDVIYSPGEGTLDENIPMPGWGWRWDENILLSFCQYLRLLLLLIELSRFSRWSCAICFSWKQKQKR